MKGKGWFLGFIILAFIFSAAQPGFGAGFALYEGSARGNALGTAVVAHVTDSSALFYNPAGITQLPGFQAMLGATFIMPSTDVVTTLNGVTTTSETEDNTWIPPHFYLTYQFNDSVWFGFATFSRFGLGTEFDENWIGRYNNYNACIQTLSANPNVALKITDQLSAAVGFEIMWFDLELEQKINPLGIINPNFTAMDVDQNLTGDSFGYGFNLALHYQPLEWLAAGISYRSKVKQNLDGDADFTKPQAVNNIALFDPMFHDTSVEGTVKLPDMLSLGVAVRPWKPLWVEIGATYTGWSSYDQLTIKYGDPVAFDPVTGAPIQEVTVHKNWKDVWRYMIGVEYSVLDWLDLRAGYVFDESPIPDETADYLLPANDRHLYNLGVGFHMNDLTVDLSYTYIDIEGRTVDARLEEGVLDSEFEDGQAHLFGISVGYKF